MSRTITTADPEFEDILRELALNRDAVAKRRDLSEASFREWLFEQIVSIGRRLGFVIQDAAEFVRDMGYGIRKGWKEGREEARKRSIRARETRS